MPKGTWYLPDQRPNRRGDPRYNGMTQAYNVQRRAHDYVPLQSIGVQDGRFDYQGRPEYPRRVNGGGGYPTHYDWMRQRPLMFPTNNHRFQLGVRGMTDRPDYDWSWYYNNRRGGYTPPDREF